MFNSCGQWVSLVFPFTRWGKGGSDRLGNLPEVTQLGVVRSRLKSGFLGHQASCYLIKHILFSGSQSQREEEICSFIEHGFKRREFLFPNLLLVFCCESRGLETSPSFLLVATKEHWVQSKFLFSLKFYTFSWHLCPAACFCFFFKLC